MSDERERAIRIQNRRHHAQQRAKERYKEWLSYEALACIDKRVHDDEGVLLRRVSATKTLWLIKWKERIYKVGYNSDTKQVTTFLPLPNTNNDIMLRMYDQLKKLKEQNKEQ